MGVKLLTTFLKTQETGDGAFKQHLSELSGKVIVIDIFIYLYKYLKEEKLLENVYLMCFVMREYNITPLFIFDGYDINKSKKLELDKRKKNKEKIKEKYDKLLNSYDEKQGFQSELVKNKLDKLSRQLIKITKKHVEDVKKLITSCGMKYIVANGEADILCSAFVKSKRAYACLTEDSDLFVYGCDRIIKYFSLLNHTFIMYDLKKILGNLDISLNELREISILSGTDYNNEITGNIFCNKKHLLQYKTENKTEEFKEWLFNNDKITMDDIETINTIKKQYILDDKDILKKCPYIVLKNRNIDYKEIKNIMINEGFIFINIL